MFRKVLFGAVSLVALTSAPPRPKTSRNSASASSAARTKPTGCATIQCLSDQLQTLLGVEKVSLFPAADYDGIIQGLLGGTLDYAELGASGYAKIYLENKDAVEPILTTVQTDGSTGYYSIMVARADSGIKTLADLKGKKLGFADPDSTSGYLIPVTVAAQGNRRAR